MADAYLPVIVKNLPAAFVFQPGGMLRDKVMRAVRMGVVRVIAGPTSAHLIIDIKRPYCRALPPPAESASAARGETP